MKSVSVSFKYFVPSISSFFIGKVLSSCRLLDDFTRVYAYLFRARRSFWSKKSFCYLTGRHRSLISSFKISRLSFKSYCMQGCYSGFKKIVW